MESDRSSRATRWASGGGDGADGSAEFLNLMADGLAERIVAAGLEFSMDVDAVDHVGILAEVWWGGKCAAKAPTRQGRWGEKANVQRPTFNVQR